MEIRPPERKVVRYRDERALGHAEPSMLGAGWRIRARHEKEFRPFGWLIDPARAERKYYGPAMDPYTSTRSGCNAPAELVFLLLLPVGLALNGIARLIWGRTRIDVLWERDA